MSEDILLKKSDLLTMFFVFSPSLMFFLGKTCLSRKKFSFLSSFHKFKKFANPYYVLSVNKIDPVFGFGQSFTSGKNTIRSMGFGY